MEDGTQYLFWAVLHVLLTRALGDQIDAQVEQVCNVARLNVRNFVT